MGHMEHAPALVVLLYLPLAIFIFLAAMDFAARESYPGARRLMAGFNALGQPAKLALLLMSMSAAIHLALIPGHAGEPATAILFALDGLALFATCLSACLVSWWRPLALALLTMSLVAFGLYLAAGFEVADPIGVSTKLIELGAVVLLMIRRQDLFVPVITKS